jgi:membrane-bound ClpP family serine protease
MRHRPEGGATVFARYLVFQLPGFVVAAALLALVVHWGHLSTMLAYVLFGVWVAIEIALFPILRIAYEQGGRQTGVEAIVGSVGVALDDLDPEGSVRLGAERWRARASGDPASVAAGTAVRVREVRQLTLVVEPADADPDGDNGAISRPRAG